MLLVQPLVVTFVPGTVIRTVVVDDGAGPPPRVVTIEAGSVTKIVVVLAGLGVEGMLAGSVMIV